MENEPQLLSFINNADLEKEVRKLTTALSSIPRTNNALDKAIPDPISAMISASTYGWTIAKQKKQEYLRQRALEKAVGDFHQTILGQIPSWRPVAPQKSTQPAALLRSGKLITVKDSGLDIISDKRQKIVQIKNKWNTIKRSDQWVVYDSLLSNLTNHYVGYTAYLVEIVPAKGLKYNKPFVPSDSSRGKRRPNNWSIRCIDGKSFYEMVTGETNTLKQLYDATAIMACKTQGTSLEELKKNPAYRHVFNNAYKRRRVTSIT